jgi:cytochrome c-type biogenesis protein
LRVGEFGALVLSYGAGALSTLSPCVLPLLPIVLVGALQESIWGPVALTAGLSASFATIGVFVAWVGFSVGLDPTTLRLSGAALIIAFGVILLVPALQGKLILAAAPIAAGGQSLIDRLRPSGLRGQFVLGILLGAVWSPCAGPTLGAAIGLAAQSDTAGRAALIMTAFSIGAATPILVLAYGSRQALLARRGVLMQVSRRGKPLMGGALITVGLFVLSGLDKTTEAILTNAMPDWLVALTTRL